MPKKQQPENDHDGLNHLKEATPGKLHEIQETLHDQGLLDTQYGGEVNKEVRERLKKPPR